ncbi:helicase-associated domain-containing protein [Leifsonia poae]|uniref:helicase-associated domain-containing protein n=1 Tax=Leifsonia poae TaxID=110933 RepID=UPI001CBE42F4|nr:helicase-associated domain-containing protein [Leifsonia poae]
MTNTLALAARLRELPDDALAEVLASRVFRRTGVTDFFDLADALLDRESLQRALSALDRPRLAVLVTLGRASGSGAVAVDPASVAAALADAPATAGPTPEVARAALSSLEDLLLVHPEGTTFAAYEAVREQLASWPALGLPAPDALVATPAPPALAPVPDTERRFTDRLAGERAFEAVASVSELLAELTREGARELQKGGLALPASKRIAGALAVDVAVVPTVLSVAHRAGLIALDDGLWLPTDAAAAWQHEPTAQRWRDLARSWQDALPDDLRSILASRSRAVWGDSLRDHVAWLYPAGREAAQERVTAYTRDAEWLGITAGHAPSTAGTALVEHGPDAAATVIGAQFPAEVDRVYLQHDLTVVSPGPLEPAIDARLRGLADVESRALAATFRVSAASLNRAIAAGETAESIRKFLSGISLTGVPQPLDYLISDAAARYGRVRVSETGDAESRTRAAIVSDDLELLTTIEVDQTLGPLALTRVAPERLESRFARDVVFWALSDARYPVAAEDAAGTVVSLRRHRVARATSPRAGSPLTELIARLREAEVTEDGTTQEQWLARQLDLAIRAKQTLIVQVAMPDGRLVEYLLEPTGVGGGRLRGRDRAADIERTLPLSSVQGIRPAEE